MIPVINKVSTAEGLPLISVIIPAYNVAKYINRAIKSVLNQTYSSFEVIIIDDGSTDQLTDLLDEFDDDSRILYVHQENAGPASARNHGLRKAKGELITFLDADDEYPNDKLTIQWNYLKEHTEIDFVSGQIQYIGQSDLKADFLFENPDEQSMRNVHLGAILCRKYVFEKVGWFDEKLQQSEDLDWWMRCLESGIRYTFLPQVLLRYHRHQNNMTLDQDENSQFFLKALHQSIQRRRATDTPKVPQLIQQSERPPFHGTPKVTILIWWPYKDKAELTNVFKQEFRAFELIFLQPEPKMFPMSQELESYQHHILEAQDFDSALSIGFDRASGIFLSVFEPKNRWITKKLSLQLEFLKSKKHITSCSYLIGLSSLEAQLTAIRSPEDNFPRLYRRNAFSTGHQFASAFTEGDPAQNVLPRVLEYRTS